MRKRFHNGRLYTVDLGDTSMPRLTIWDLTEERDTCYLVLVWGAVKVLKREKAGRQFFTDQGKAVQFLRRCYREELKEAKRQQYRMEHVLARNDDFVMGYARNGVDESLIVERAVPEELA